MRFLARAGELLSDYDCDYCEQPIRPADPVQWDVDGDENGTRVTDIAHAICYEHAREAATRAAGLARAAAFSEAAKLGEFNSKEDALIALKSRSDQAFRRALKPVTEPTLPAAPSGAGIFHALFGDLGQAS
jgi:hypothetical protein